MYAKAHMPTMGGFVRDIHVELEPEYNGGAGGGCASGPATPLLAFGVEISSAQWDYSYNDVSGIGAQTTRATHTLTAMPQGIVGDSST
jgi:hypothetical protein